MTDIEIQSYKEEIDKMSQVEMASRYRFAPSGDPFFRNDLPLYEYFNERFQKLGGMTTEISKRIGW